MTNLVYYVIEPDEAGRLLRQIVPSWHSLRSHDRDVEVHLFYAGDPPARFRDQAAQCNVTIHLMPHLIDTLSRYTPHWRELSAYPTYGKHLCIDLLPQADQVLYVDCDTFWFASPARLFEAYRGCDFYGCCEVASRLFDPTSYNGEFIDEDALGRICAQEGLAFVPPINTGVMLTTASMRHQLISRHRLLLDFATRLLGFSHAARIPLPTNTPWITEQIALWMTLGSVHGLSYDFLAPQHVPLSTCWKWQPAAERVLAHYFSSNEQDFARNHAWLLQQS
jgi:hypothetical protein